MVAKPKTMSNGVELLCWKYPSTCGSAPMGVLNDDVEEREVESIQHV